MITEKQSMEIRVLILLGSSNDTLSKKFTISCKTEVSKIFNLAPLMMISSMQRVVS